MVVKETVANGTPLSRQTPPYKLHLKHHLSPGDVVAMTACVESLHRKYPGKYQVSVDTTCPDIWKYNPRVSNVPAHQCHVVDMHYPAVNEAGTRAVHFMGGFCEYLGQAIGQPVPLLVNRPALYLGPDEGPLDGIPSPYIVVNAGRKDDYTAKWGGSWLWQQVANRLKDKVAIVQVGEGHHHHPPLDGVINLVGKTNTREFFRLVRHARAAAGPVSFMLHTAAAFNTPYVCLAGGREEPSWESYNSTVYLHTIGQLDCCREKACWRSRTVPLKDGCGRKDASLCSLPVLAPDGEYVPKCLEMIGPDKVAAALEQILGGG